MTRPEQSETLREEFNRWAEAGRGEGMELDHWPITRPALERMRIARDENLLDVGCGAGWLSRALARAVPGGRVVGMDISDEMIRHARAASVDFENLVFVVGQAGEIPWESNFFTRAISVESSYYWPDPAKGLREIYRVLAEGGSAWIIINYYRDNPHCHQWGGLLAVPTRLLSGDEWAGLFRDAGSLKSNTGGFPIQRRFRSFTQADGFVTQSNSQICVEKGLCSSTEQNKAVRVCRLRLWEEGIRLEYKLSVVVLALASVEFRSASITTSTAAPSFSFTFSPFSVSKVFSNPVLFIQMVGVLDLNLGLGVIGRHRRLDIFSTTPFFRTLGLRFIVPSC